MCIDKVPNDNISLFAVSKPLNKFTDLWFLLTSLINKKFEAPEETPMCLLKSALLCVYINGVK